MAARTARQLAAVGVALSLEPGGDADTPPEVTQRVGQLISEIFGADQLRMITEFIANVDAGVDDGHRELLLQQLQLEYQADRMPGYAIHLEQVDAEVFGRHRDYYVTGLGFDPCGVIRAVPTSANGQLPMSIDIRVRPYRIPASRSAAQRRLGCAVYDRIVPHVSTRIGTPRDRCGPPLSSNESSPCSLPRSPSHSSEPVGRVLGIDAHHCPRVPRQHGARLIITHHRGLLTAAVIEWSQAFCGRASPERPTQRLDIEPACAMCPRLRRMEHRRRKATLSSKREEERHALLHFCHTAHEFTDEVAGAARGSSWIIERLSMVVNAVESAWGSAVKRSSRGSAFVAEFENPITSRFAPVSVTWRTALSHRCGEFSQPSTAAAASCSELNRLQHRRRPRAHERFDAYRNYGAARCSAPCRGPSCTGTQQVPGR